MCLKMNLKGCWKRQRDFKIISIFDHLGRICKNLFHVLRAQKTANFSHILASSTEDKNSVSDPVKMTFWTQKKRQFRFRLFPFCAWSDACRDFHFGYHTEFFISGFIGLKKKTPKNHSNFLNFWLWFSGNFQFLAFYFLARLGLFSLFWNLKSNLWCPKIDLD